jgi:hypothetical protein
MNLNQIFESVLKETESNRLQGIMSNPNNDPECIQYLQQSLKIIPKIVSALSEGNEVSFGDCDENEITIRPLSNGRAVAFLSGSGYGYEDSEFRTRLSISERSIANYIISGFCPFEDPTEIEGDGPMEIFKIRPVQKGNGNNSIITFQ